MNVLKKISDLVSKKNGPRPSASQPQSPEVRVSSSELALTEQAVSIESLAARMGDLNNKLKTSRSKQFHQADKGVSFVLDMVSQQGASEATLVRIENSIKSMGEALAGLNEVEEAIRKIEVKTHAINEIVAKTQLLSFNASLEAAHAGQYGKGFAVVAEEVGRLAKTSGLAAREIQSLITNARSRMDKTLKQYEHRFEDGLVIGREAKDNHERHTLSLAQISEFFKTIAEACLSQNVHGDQIALVLKEIDMKTRHLIKEIKQQAQTRNRIEEVLVQTHFEAPQMNFQISEEEKSLIASISEKTKGAAPTMEAKSPPSQIDPDDPSFTSQE